MGQTVDYVYALSASELSAALAWIGALSYMLQIYFDFSGYSDMAIGLGQMFGFHFKENFDHPYAADSMQNFWRRWHISLTNWFREYVYIPLGGNRKGITRTWINRFIVFFCTGLWHGANLTFIVWGLYHGAFLTLETVIKKPKKKLGILPHIYVIAAVCIGFVIFRSDNIYIALNMITTMFTAFTMNMSQYSALLRIFDGMFIFTFIIALIFSFPIGNLLNKFRENKKIYNALNVSGYIAGFALLILNIASLAGSTYNPFIYFRF